MFKWCCSQICGNYIIKCDDRHSKLCWKPSVEALNDILCSHSEEWGAKLLMLTIISMGVKTLEVKVLKKKSN